MHRSLFAANDLVVGVPVAGQAVSGKQKLVGRCIKFPPLRQTVESDESFERLAAAAKRTLLDAYDYQDFTYVGLMQELQQSRGISQPLVLISFNIDLQLNPPAFNGLACEVRKTPKHFVSFDVVPNLVDTGIDYTIEWEYDSDLFTEDMSQRWMGLFWDVPLGSYCSPRDFARRSVGAVVAHADGGDGGTGDSICGNP